MRAKLEVHMKTIGRSQFDKQTLGNGVKCHSLGTGSEILDVRLKVRHFIIQITDSTTQTKRGWPSMRKRIHTHRGHTKYVTRYNLCVNSPALLIRNISIIPLKQRAHLRQLFSHVVLPSTSPPLPTPRETRYMFCVPSFRTSTLTSSIDDFVEHVLLVGAVKLFLACQFPKRGQ